MLTVAMVMDENEHHWSLSRPFIKGFILPLHRLIKAVSDRLSHAAKLIKWKSDKSRVFCNYPRALAEVKIEFYSQDYIWPWPEQYIPQCHLMRLHSDVSLSLHTDVQRRPVYSPLVFLCVLLSQSSPTSCSKLGSDSLLLPPFQKKKIVHVMFNFLSDDSLMTILPHFYASLQMHMSSQTA